MPSCDIGLVGLAVMGQNLARNMDRNGFKVAVYNRTTSITDEFMAGPGQGTNLVPTQSLEEFVAALASPRRIFLMVKAGRAVDAVIESLLPLLDPGDMVMDGGNSLFGDTERRAGELAAQGFRYLGVGVSGGEEGALWGPSIMPGGDRDAYQAVAPVLTSIAAKHEDEPCVAYMGSGGSGHFVKMVHNGIEYGDMQLIVETYDLMQRGLGMSPPEMAEIFAQWNQGDLASYLIEITADILTVTDKDTGKPLVDVILDKAGQKGTGRWTTQTALDLGASIQTINSAVDARILSGFKEQREQAARVLPGPESRSIDHKKTFIEQLRDGLYMAKLCSYAQGFSMLSIADKEYGYGLDAVSIARIWREGCIIRARFLDDVAAAFEADPDLASLLMAPTFQQAVDKGQAALRSVVATAAELGIPTPAMAASLAYYDGFRSARLPANLIQAQRDYFGAHTYQRVDRNGTFHTQWLDELNQE